MERTGRLWLLEKHTEFWDGEEWVEFTFDSSAAQYLEIPLSEIDRTPRRAREVICEITFDQLRDEIIAAGFEPEDLAAAKTFQSALPEYGTPAQEFIRQGFQPIAKLHRFDVSVGEVEDIEINAHTDGRFLMAWTVEEVFEDCAWHVDYTLRQLGDARPRHKIHGHKPITRAEAAQLIRDNCIPEMLAADVLAATPSPSNQPARI